MIMYYQIVNEYNEVFVASTTFINTVMTVTFKDIPEENKFIELDNAARIRFKHFFFIKENKAIDINNNGKYLKLIPQSNDYNAVDVPSLLLML